MTSSLRFFPWWVVVPVSVSLVAAAGSFGCSSDDDTKANDEDTNTSSSGGGSSGEDGTSSSGGASSGSSGNSSSGNGSSGNGSSSGSSGTGSSSGSSQGTGGITCDRMRDLDVAPDAGARQACQAVEGGAEYRFVLPANPSGPMKLAVYLHGDNAGAHNSNSAIEALLPWLDAHNAMMVSVRAPNSCSWWLKNDFDCPLQADASVDEAVDRDLAHGNATALDAIFKKLRAAYDIGNGPVFYYGSSGGSVFLTNSFFPKFGNVYPGAFALNCGGETPAAGAFTWDAQDAAQRGPTKFWFTYTSGDSLVPTIRDAKAYYDGLGIPSAERVTAGGHCAFDGHGRAGEVWSEFLGE